MIFTNLLERLKKGEADFEDVIAYVSNHYEYTPTRFRNGNGADAVINEAGKNEGSCRIFALARHKGLSEADTLPLFGRFYHDDVLKNPDGTDHGNIRTFMREGWAGIHFEGEALVVKED